MQSFITTLLFCSLISLSQENYSEERSVSKEDNNKKYFLKLESLFIPSAVVLAVLSFFVYFVIPRNRFSSTSDNRTFDDTNRKSQINIKVILPVALIVVASVLLILYYRRRQQQVAEILADQENFDQERKIFNDYRQELLKEKEKNEKRRKRKDLDTESIGSLKDCEGSTVKITESAFERLANLKKFSANKIYSRFCLMTQLIFR